MGATSGVPGGQIARWSWGMTLALLAWNLGTAPVSAGIGEVDVTVIDDDCNDAGPSANVKVVIEPTPPDNTSGGGASGGVGGGNSNGGAGGSGRGGSFGIVGVLLLLALGTVVQRRRFVMLDARLQ